MKLKSLPVLTLTTFLVSLLAISTLPNKAFSAPATNLVISEVQIGQSGTGNAGNDFIELYNPTNAAIDLNGFRLVKRTAGDATDDPIKAWDSEAIVPAHGYYLWANNGWTPSVTPDTTTSATIAADNGVALRQGAADVGTIIDSAGWDQAANAFVEGTAFPQDPPNDNSIERKPCVGSTNGNSEDTGNNSSDFVLRTTPEPQNAASTPEIPTCSEASPTPSPTESSSPTPTATVTATPTESPTPSPTESSTPEPTESPEPTETPEPTVSSTPTASPTPTATVTATPTARPTFNFNIECRVVFKTFGGRFFRIIIPRLICSIVR